MGHLRFCPLKSFKATFVVSKKRGLFQKWFKVNLRENFHVFAGKLETNIFQQYQIHLYVPIFKMLLLSSITNSIFLIQLYHFLLLLAILASYFHF